MLDAVRNGGKDAGVHRFRKYDDDGNSCISARTTPWTSLIDLRRRTAGMLPGVDLPGIVLEVMAEYPAFASAFTAVSGGTTRLKDMHISIPALLTAPDALNHLTTDH